MNPHWVLFCFSDIADKKWKTGLVWKMVNTWPKKLLCYPLSKICVFDFLIYWIFREKKQRNKTKSWYLVNSCCFRFAFHGNLMSDGKKKRPKLLFITPLILLINMSISLFRWRIWLIKFPLQRQQSYVV